MRNIVLYINIDQPKRHVLNRSPYLTVPLPTFTKPSRVYNSAGIIYAALNSKRLNKVYLRTDLWHKSLQNVISDIMNGAGLTPIIR